MALNINETSFAQLQAEGKPMMIDFWATWCGPCKKLAPVVEQLAEEWAGRVNIVKCDIEEAEELASQYRVTSIPTVVFLDANGEVVNRLVGLQPKVKIEAELNKLV